MQIHLMSQWRALDPQNDEFETEEILHKLLLTVSAIAGGLKLTG